VTIRWAADDYKGKSVAHCHDLTHADTGMVLNFQIV
jgi:FtsP/CotA-like multicopper oxidase with cupredoxin domain